MTSWQWKQILARHGIKLESLGGKKNMKKKIIKIPQNFPKLHWMSVTVAVLRLYPNLLIAWIPSICLQNYDNYYVSTYDQWGLSSESEISQRKQVQSITDPANLGCEMVPFEFKKPGCHPEIMETEFGYVTDLSQFIHLRLVKNEKYNHEEIV